MTNNTSKKLKTVERQLGSDTTKDLKINEKAFASAVEEANYTMRDVLEEKFEGLSGEKLAKEAEKMIPAIEKA
jgi:hypothetical protein